MIFDFLKKQKKVTDRKRIISIMIMELNISEAQKTLYLEALEIIDETKLDGLYETISNFTKKLEEEKYEKIRKDNFSYIAGMTNKEAQEKQKEINSFNFLINNV